MKQINYWVNILAILGFIYIIFIFIKSTIFHSKQKQELISNQYFTVAKLDSITDTYEGTKYKQLCYKFHYHYVYHNTLYNDYSTYRSSEFYKFSTFKRKQIINKDFPIIISIKNPPNNQSLFLRTEYSRFNITFPDSLKWTKKLFYYK